MALTDSEDVRLRWAEAYAAQSRSDFDVYLRLPPNVAECHRLHYLQMACEKIAKAYRLRDTRTASQEEMSSHVAFSKFIENFLAAGQVKARYRSQASKLLQIGRVARRLAREIEKLAPAVDREQSPVNAEYPWSDGQTIVVPCRYDYPNLGLLKKSGGREFLRLVQLAIEDFERIKIT